MRHALSLVALTLFVASPVHAGDLKSLRGPAADTIRSYLKQEKLPCAQDPAGDCPLTEQILYARLSYGRFPGDSKDVAALFLYEDSGGSGVNMSVQVWTSNGGAFSLLGETNAIGTEARDVRFEKGGVIAYTGTVSRAGDSHCCPTGSSQFKIRVTNGSVKFGVGK